MKAALYFMTMACTGVLSSQAAMIIAELPSSNSTLPNSGSWTHGTVNPKDFMAVLKGKGPGVYAGTNSNNNLTNWGINGEGTWTNVNNIGSIILCGRSGVSGDSFGMVLGGPQAGDVVSSITFSCNSPTSIITSYTMVLGVYDASGALVQELSSNKAFTFGSTSQTTSLSLDMTGAPLVWGEGYKLVAGIYGGGGSGTAAYTISGIQVSYDILPVPEPATASLGLFGLGALLMRRRR